MSLKGQSIRLAGFACLLAVALLWGCSSADDNDAQAAEKEEAIHRTMDTDTQASELVDAPAANGVYSTTVQPFFEQHCVTCHGPDKTKGGLRIDELTADLDDLISVEHLQNILDELTHGTMPPEDEPRPDADALIEVTQALTEHIARAKEKHNSGGGRPLRRLSQKEFVNSVWDLLGVFIPDHTLPADGSVGKFDTNADLLFTTDLHFQTYLSASRHAVERFIASRAQVPGRSLVNRIRNPQPRRNRYIIPMNGAPPAGHMVLRMACWLEEPNPENPAYIGLYGRPAINVEVTGTPQSPQHIDLEVFDYAGTAVGGAGPGALGAVKEIQRIKVVNPQPYEFFAPFLKDYGDDPRDDDARAILDGFVKLIGRGHTPDRAFVSQLYGIFEQGRQQGQPFWEALVEPMAVALCSAEFLLHIEMGNLSQQAQPVTGIELANRLSYFLWRSAPDSELVALGRSRDLLGDQVLAAQVRRMMDDPKFDRFLNDFTDQWLELERQDLIDVDSRLYPDFRERFKASMKQETVAFVSHLVREDLPLSNLIDSDFMVINNDMARYYGLPLVGDQTFRVVTPGPEGSTRGGILTHAGILMQTGTGDRTSIVERGVFVSRKILGVDPPPPPANVDALPTEGENVTDMTAAQLVQMHTNIPQCVSCHSKIDPLGMGLEAFDAVGSFRTLEKRLAPNLDQLDRRQRRNPRNFYYTVRLETHGRLPDGEAYQGIDGLKQALMGKQDMLAASYTNALLSYANGREAGIADLAAVDQIVGRASADDYPARSILEDFLLSEAFTHKPPAD